MTLEFHVGRCRVGVGFSCFALLSACCVFTGMDGGAACFAAVFLHECAHLAAMWAFHAPPDRVELSALGCRVVQGESLRITDRQQAMVSLAGPGANLLCFLIAALIGQSSSAFSGASLVLGIAHSLPIEPLDGGLALRYWLQSRLGERLAGQISRGVSVLFLIPLAILGFLILLNTKYNYSLLALSIYIMLYLLLGKDYALP